MRVGWAPRVLPVGVAAVEEEFLDGLEVGCWDVVDEGRKMGVAELEDGVCVEEAAGF